VPRQLAEKTVGIVMRSQQRLDAIAQLRTAGAGFVQVGHALRRILFFQGGKKNRFLGHGEASGRG
jgi:hypothetical protein